MRILPASLFLICAVSSLFGGEFKVGSLNCDHLCSPLLDRPDSTVQPLNLQEYQVKLDNLGRLISSSQVESIGLLGVSGSEEVSALMERLNKSGFWQPAGSESSGDGLAYLYNLKEGYSIKNMGRVWSLRSVNEHMVVKYSPAKKSKEPSIYILVVKLTAPNATPASVAKHQKELLVVKKWAESTIKSNKNSIVVTLGETHDGAGVPDTSVLNFPCEKSASLSVLGAKWKSGAVLEPVLDIHTRGEKKRVFTEHYLLAGQVEY